MRRWVISALVLLVAVSAHAQGTVNFVNKITGTLDARVTHGGIGAIGGGATPYTQFVAQLYQLSGTVGPIGDPIPFRNSGPGTGYWVGQTRTLIGVPENASATVKVVVWTSAFGATYAEAVAKGFGHVGESAPVTITTGGGFNPPGALLGLQGFDMPNIPEPSIGVLSVLGAGLLLRPLKPRRVVTVTS